MKQRNDHGRQSTLSNPLGPFLQRARAFAYQTYDVPSLDISIQFFSRALLHIPFVILRVGVTNDSHSVPRDEEDKTDTQASKEETAEETVTKDRDLVPWTITNKYYTADVHFQLADWHNPAPSLKSGIPAIVVIWEKGEVRR